jgi:putative inorganic carbon (HCO3(-)) transporter
MGRPPLGRVRARHVAAVVFGLAIGLIVAHQPLIALGLVIGAAVFVVLILRADLTLLVMIAALPWENELNFPTETLSAVKGIGAVVMFAYVLRLVSRRKTFVHLPALLGVATSFTLWVGVSVITSTGITDSVQKLIRYLLFFVFFFLVVQLVDGRPQVRRALRCFVASVGAAAVYGVWLFVTGKTNGRVSGPVEDPNDFAYLLACTLPLAAYLMTVEGARRLPWAFAFMAIAGAMLLTFSRGAITGLTALLVWSLVTRRVPVRALLAGAAALVLVALLALTIWRPLLNSALHQKAHIATANQDSRESFWRGALQLTIDRPVTGVGPARFPEEVTPLLRNNPESLTQPVTHNSYLEILSEDGVPALLLFIAYLGGIWLTLRGVQRRAAEAGDADEQRMATALQASVIIAIVSATFLSEQLTTPFWLLGALATVLWRGEPFVPPAMPALSPAVRPPRLSPAGPTPALTT